MKKLVIVESPSKCKPIGKYLGDEYVVLSSKGHIRDLATTGKYGFGVDVENNFKPTYIPIKGKSKTITDLKREAKKASIVYLATDPDREGEAISWHLFDALGLAEDKYHRVIFNEITKDAVQNAFKSNNKIDQDLVNSQETRRILDRIIGFRLSKLMQSKTEGKSAGRVQSVVLKLIVDREREIEAFNPEEYWSIHALFNEFEAELVKYKNKKIEIPNEHTANEILASLSHSFTISDVEAKLKAKKSPMPFITSSLQQLASSKLGFGAKKTMQIAQKLYEGIDLENETTGLITYMRTDSYRLSDEFISHTFKYIEGKYGKEYVGHRKVVKSKDGVQDAHEAIRPTDIMRTPISVKSYLTPDQFKLYSLIYKRTLASLMADAKVNATKVTLLNNDYVFTATGQVLVFDGYLKEYQDYEDSTDIILPDFTKYKTNVLAANDIKSEQHFTKPPARYTEAKLIKAMEELGIGRPSTYASTVDTLRKRLYITEEAKRLFPTKIGFEITDKLQEFFSNIINVEYTANMENDLDKIAKAEIIWYEVLQAFYDKFTLNLDTAFNEMTKKEPEITGEQCPECGSAMVYKTSRYGRFEACSNYPTCKYIKQKEVAEKKVVATCPKCKGNIVEKKTRKGKVFFGCDNYPKCNYATWNLPTGDNCPECGDLLVNTKTGIACNNCEDKA